MANDKKFIVKNGILTPENAVIGSTTDTGEKLQVTGDSVLTQGTPGTATLKVTNSGGHSAATIIASFEGDSDSLQIRNTSAGDYKITNPQQDNSINFYDGTAGITINYAGTEKLAFSSTGADFKDLANTTIEGNRILTTADEGSGNNLDADTVDGLEGSQFLRSDVADTAVGKITFSDDIEVTGSAQIDTNITIDGQAVIKALLDAQANAQVAGNLTVSGDFTVSGNTTYVNTEEILLSDNIITLNANYTGSTPTENAGIEVERGTLNNPKLVWNETSDYWQLEVNNAVVGRIITTADEGSGNLFDADTVDGLEAAQFLRSDVDDTATGNITIEGDLTVGDGAGAAQIIIDGTGQSRTIYADNGTIGFLGAGGNYAASSDADGDFIVVRDVEAGRNVIADDDVTATSGNIAATAGSVTAGTTVAAGTTVTGGTGVIATTGNVSATVGDVTAGNDVTAAQDITATAGDITATAGDVIAGDSVTAENNITATTGNISATAGSVSAGTTVTGGTGVTATTGNVSASAGDVVAQNNVTATTGNVTATAGDVIAGDDVTAQNNITATAGNISATAGSVAAGTTVTAGTDVIGQRFVDADNNAYLVNPASDSIMHAIGIDDDLYHNGDTDTKLSFATDTVDIDTGGSTRLTANNSGVTVTGDLDVTGNLTAVDGTFSGDLSASRFLDSDNNTYLLDPNLTSVLNRVGIDDYIQHNGDTNTFFGFDSNDNVIVTTAGVERLEINATNITGTVDAIFPDVYAGTFYDLNNATYYVNPAGNSRMSGIGLVGTIFHDGDTNTYLNFNAADSFEIVTGGVQRLQVTTFTTAAGSVRSPLFYDSNDTNYYGNFAGTSQMSQIDIDSYIRHRGDTNNYFGFDGADSQTFVTNAVERLNITNANSTFTHDVIVQGDVQANRFVDRNSTGYFVNPADPSVSATFDGAVRIGVITDDSRWSDSSGNGGIVLLSPDTQGSAVSGPTIAISGPYASGYALQYMNRIDAGNNPYNAGNRYIEFGTDGVAGATVRGDLGGNLYLVPKAAGNIGFWTSTGSEIAVGLDDGNFIIGGSAVTYTVSDNTPLVGSMTNNRLHVNGSIALNGDNDAIVFGNGTSTFLKDEELGFGWGGGLYMTDATYLRIRNNKTLYSAGDAWFNRFYAYDNTAYYVDPNGDSQLNTIDIDDYIRHRGDTNTLIGFPGADAVKIDTNGVERFRVDANRVRARNKLEVWGSGIELQKNSNGGGVGITITDQGSTETPGLAALQQASIKVWHADNSVTAGAGLAMVFDSSEASTHYVFGDTNGTVGGTLIPRVTNQGNLGLSTYRWSNVYAQTGNFSANVTASNMYAQRFYDSNDNTYYADPASTSIFNVLNLENHAAPANNYAPIQINNGNATGDIDTPESWIQFAFADGNANFTPQVRIGARAGTVGSADDLDKEGSGNFIVETAIGSGGAGAGTLRQTFAVDYLGNSLSLTSSRAPIFYDSDNTTYFANPGAESRLATIKLEDGVILRSPNGTFGSLTVSGTGRGGYEGFSINDRVVFMHNNANTSGIYNDVNNHWLFRGENGGETAMYYNGTQQLRALNGYALADNQMRAPIFYDSNDTAYYADPASTSRFNAVQALRYYFNHATTYYADAASGNYGSMEVGGYKSGWAGYSIAGNWVFMSDGVTNAGIYNDTDNEWATRYYRNSHVELMFNGTWEGRTESNYFRARSSFRAPIFYDIDDTAYFGDFASRSKLKTLELGNQGNLTGSASYPLGIYHNNRYLIGMRNSGAQAEYPWLVHDNYNFGGKGARSAFIIHFNGLGDKFNLTEDGDLLIAGEMAASNYNLSGGNENISLSKLYTRGAADETLFDGTMYFEKRVIQQMQGAENPTTSDTSEFVKSPDAPGGSSYVLRTAAYRNFYSDYIEVEPGEQVFGEIHQKTISGSGGRLYYGIERFDKDKNPIAGNTGTTYFVVGGSTPTQTTWQTYRNHHTLPTSHTPYGGSDGGGVRYVRLRILYNYPSGGALREFTMPILKRVNYHSNIKTDYDVYASIFRDNNNSAYYMDLDSISYLNDIRPNILYDRQDTAFYVDPQNTTRLNRLHINARGDNTNVGSINTTNQQADWNNLTNTSGQFTVTQYNAIGSFTNAPASVYTYGSVLSTRTDNHSFQLYSAHTGDLAYKTQWNNDNYSGWLSPVVYGRNAGSASGKNIYFDRGYDTDNTAYYIDPNSESRLNVVKAQRFAHMDDVSQDDQFGLYFSSGQSTAYAIYREGGAWTNPYPDLRIAFHTGIKFGANASYQGMRFYNDYNMATQVMSVNNGSDPLGANNVYVNNSLQAGSSLRAPIFYDTNTAWYGDFASTSRMNTVDANYLYAREYAYIKGASSNGQSHYQWDGATYRNPGSYTTRLYVRQDHTGAGLNASIPALAIHNNLGVDQGTTSLVFTSREGPTSGNSVNLAGIIAKKEGAGTVGGWSTGSLHFFVKSQGTRRDNMFLHQDGHVQSPFSFRAPIFYDSDNTAYYSNPAGDTNWQGLSARGQAMIGLPGHTRSGAISNNGRRPNITSDSNYWTGSKGWGTVDLNTVAHWGSGFFDTWSNPANQPSGTSHWVGVQAYHYSNGGTQHGWQMAGGPIGNLRFRNSWSSFGSWKTIPMLGVNSGNGGDMYAGRYYDSNDTAYYADPASTSVFNAMVFNGDVDFNGGANALNITSSDIRSSGSSTWTGNPGASIGKIQMHSNRWYIVSNGNSNRIVQFRQDGSDKSYIANDGRLIGPGGNATQDWRAPVFYDSDNTGYYANPAGQSHFNTLTLAGNRIGFINTSFDAEIVVSDSNPDGTGADFVLWGDRVQYNARLITEVVHATRHMRAQVYYDVNNASYYGDFGGTSYMNDVRANIFYERENTAYYFGSSQGDARMRNVRFNNIQMEDGATFTSVNNNGRMYLGGNFHIDAQGSQDLYLNYYSGRRTRSFTPGQYEAFRVDTNRIVYNFSETRSPIYYDYNDTNYYGNFASNSRLYDLQLRGNYARTYAHSGSDFTAGTLVRTSIPATATNGASFVLEATGKSYSGDIPFSFTAQGYLYANTIINYSGQHIGKAGFGTMYVFQSGGVLCFWWPRVSYWNSFAVHVRNANGDDINLVTSITNSGLPSRTKERQIAMRTTAVHNTNIGNGDLYAQRFIDSNNTGYYGDFASTSNMNTVQINGTLRFMNYGLGVTGTYTSTRLQTIFNMDDQYSVSADGSSAQNAYGVYWSHPNAGSLGGANNLSDHGMLIINNGSWRAAIGPRAVFRDDVRATLFYDRNNTGYYADPASTSRFNTLRTNRLYPCYDNNSGIYLDYVTGDYGSLQINGGGKNGYEGLSFDGRFVMMTSDSSMIGLYNDTDNEWMQLWYRNSYTSLYYNGTWEERSGSGQMYARSSYRAPIFYDSNDTGYYMDPNSTSNAAIRQRGGTFHGPNTSWGQYLYVGTNGWAGAAHASVASTNGNLHLDAKAGYSIYLNNYVGGTTYVIGNLQADRFYDRNNTTYYGDFASVSYMNDVRANILYDRENTAYYFGSGQGDFRGRTGRANEMYVDSWFRNYAAGRGLYNQATGRHFYSPGSGYWHLDSSNGLILYGSYQASQGTGTDRKGYLYHDGSGFGLLNSSGNWGLRLYPGNSSAEVYRTFYADSIQANILYDRNNTGYYFNGASLRSTRFEGVSNRTMAHMNLPGHTRSSGEYYRSRAQRTSDTNYWTGSMGWGNVNMNTVAHWGSGFIDSWSNPANQPSGTSHWVGMQAYHYSNGGAQHGWQMVGGPIDNLRFRNSWSSFKAWRTIPVLDINNGNGGSMYAGRYYDSNSTGYYMDPASTSNYSTSQQNGYHTFLNYGVGVTGTYTSTRLQQVFAMGSSYRMRSDGNATNNMYGIAWSHPNAGSKGGANNLNDHGLLIINNGGFRAAISSRAVFSNDCRATLFYDYNNTGYYVDPNSSGTSVRIAGDIACDANYGKGLYGVYSSVRYQNVWSMGSSWRLPANGTTTGNLYGLAYSHPNAGGAAGNLDSHGLLILINGGFGSAMSYSIKASGNVTAYSDERLKTNWKPMPEDFVSRLAEIRVGIYDRTDGMQITQVGVSAQSLQTLLPEAVTTAQDEMGTLSVNYGGAALASAVELAKAIKEQQTIINNQQQEINDLKDMVSALMNKLS